MTRTVKTMFLLLVTVTTSLIIANKVTEIAVIGAQQGGDGISKISHNRALLFPDKFYWETYPFGLLLGFTGGLIIFVVGYFLFIGKKK